MLKFLGTTSFDDMVQNRNDVRNDISNMCFHLVLDDLLSSPLMSIILSNSNCLKLRINIKYMKNLLKNHEYGLISELVRHGVSLSGSDE